MMQRNPPEEQVQGVTEDNMQGTASREAQVWHSHGQLTHGQFESPELLVGITERINHIKCI